MHYAGRMRLKSPKNSKHESWRGGKHLYRRDSLENISYREYWKKENHNKWVEEPLWHIDFLINLLKKAMLKVAHNIILGPNIHIERTFLCRFEEMMSYTDFI